MEVRDYVIRRTLVMIPSLLFISIGTFLLTRVASSPIGLYVSNFASEEQIELVREIYHLNDPLWVQYLYWLRGALQGDLGWSEISNATVMQVLLQKAPATIELALVGFLLACMISLSLGTMAGRNPDSWIDHGSRALAVSGVSLPMFWVALMLVFVGYVVLGIFPIGRADPQIWRSIPHPTGFYTVDAVLAGSLTAFKDAIWHLVLPASVIGYSASAAITRHLRGEIIEKSREEFADAARARGLPESAVYTRHIRRNSLIPTVTVALSSLVIMLGGIVVVELVFAWPGLGRWVTNAALSGDYASIMGFILFIAVVTLVLMLLLDVIYVYLDPRIELGE